MSTDVPKYTRKTPRNAKTRKSNIFFHRLNVKMRATFWSGVIYSF